jgi:nucleoid DNA-binding protein
MKSIDKRLFTSKVSKKLNRSIEVVHINSIINLLCESLLKKLEDSGEFSIENFGTFQLQKTKPRKYFNVLEQEFKVSEGNNLIKFKLNRKLKKKIAKHVDLDKTIGEDDGSTD